MFPYEASDQLGSDASPDEPKRVWPAASTKIASVKLPPLCLVLIFNSPTLEPDVLDLISANVFLLPALSLP